MLSCIIYTVVPTGTPYAHLLPLSLLELRQVGPLPLTWSATNPFIWTTSLLLLNSHFIDYL